MRFGAHLLLMQVTVDRIGTHGHRTRMQGISARRALAVRQVAPALRLAEPFPAVLTIQLCATAAQQFYVAAAYQVIHRQLPRLGPLFCFAKP
jgi:hypothetical protein